MTKFNKSAPIMTLFDIDCSYPMENISVFITKNETWQNKTKSKQLFRRVMERPQLCLVEANTSKARRSVRPFHAPHVGRHICRLSAYICTSLCFSPVFSFLAALSPLAEKRVTSSTDGVWGARSSRVRFMVHLAAPCSWWFRCHNRCSHNSS